MKNKKYIQPILAAIIGIVLLIPAFIRDLKLESLYPSDLRNRQVGARLIKDGIEPYFYHYHNDGTRYLDIKNCEPTTVSNITATPYLHQLLMPACDLPFRTFSFTWLIICYVLLATMYLLMQNISWNNGKIMVWLATVLLPYTEAWKTHIYQGQYYLVIPVLLVLFYWAFVKNRNWFYLLFAGLAYTSVILIRPTAILFLLPFLFLIKHYKLQFIAVIGCGIIALLCIVSSSFQRNLWSKYSASVAEHVKAHQGNHPTAQKNMPLPVIAEVEGFDLKVTKANDDIFIYSEYGNFHTFWEMAFKKRIPLNLLYGIELSIILILFALYFLFHKKQKTYSLLNACFLGFTLLMIADLFAPINRGQYNTVQWIFPLLLLSQVKFEKQISLYIGFIFWGFILNLLNIPFIKMEHTIGEYCMLLGCIGLAMKKLPQTFSFTTSTTQTQRT